MADSNCYLIKTSQIDFMNPFYLQAAMGIGLAVEGMIKILVFGVLPLLTIIFTYRSLSRQKKPAGEKFTTREILAAGLGSFLYAILVLLILVIVLFVVLSLIFKLSDS